MMKILYLSWMAVLLAIIYLEGPRPAIVLLAMAMAILLAYVLLRKDEP